MNRLALTILNYKKSVVAVFLAIAAVCAVLAVGVNVNYNLVDYLPRESQSTQAIEIMKTEFGGQLPNARVMVQNVTPSEALVYKDKLSAIPGVQDVTWLDDAVGRETIAGTPTNYLDLETVRAYYRENTALYTVTIESGKEREAVSAIRTLIDEADDNGNAVAGDAVNSAAMQEMSGSEVGKAMLILIPVILVILILTTTSWVEPILFLAAIGIAVVINMGTNFLFGEVSFVTQSVSPILQMAVSLDYAIFLLHSFRDYRKTMEPKEAMAAAMKRSLSAVAASAATTVVGFFALLFMRFGIGSDLGLVLVKGVLLSFVSVMVFLPALTLLFYKLIDKTSHKPFLPSFGKLAKGLLRIGIPVLILAVVAVGPAYLAQSKTGYLYGTDSSAAATRAGEDQKKIESVFGTDNLLVLLVPRNDPGREESLVQSLNQISHVTSVISYVSTVGSDIPPEYLPADTVSQFYSANYARILIYTDLGSEGTDTFQTVQTIRDTASGYYPKSYLGGAGATLTDMKDIVSTDNVVINIAAIIGILLVLLLTFRSLSIPLILIFTIETAIWVNLSFGYFSGQSYNFIGFLVISTVQLGATVDYAILLTDHYMTNRKTMRKREAIRQTLTSNLPAVITSALILSLAGFTLALTSTNRVVSELGTLLGRGTALSLFMVTCVLPSLLLLLDRFIDKTTWKSRFIPNHTKTRKTDDTYSENGK